MTNVNPDTVSHPAVVRQTPLGPEPVTVVCPFCGATVLTNVKLRPTVMTHVLAVILFCICIFLVFLPYIISSCKKPYHYCSICGAFLGTFDA